MMDISSNVLSDLLDFHRDCRRHIYDAVSRLSDEDLKRPIAPGQRSILDTLLHCLRAEHFWVQHGLLQKETVEYTAADYPSIGEVRALATEVEQDTRACLSALSEHGFSQRHSVIVRFGPPVECTPEGALLHVILHDAHHRGELVAVLKRLGNEPPLIDFLTH